MSDASQDSQVRARTRLKISETALRLFTEEGFDQVPVQRIADEAGITQRTFFRYFSSKDSVLFSHEFSNVHHLEDLLTEKLQTADSALGALKESLLELTAFYDNNRNTLTTIYGIILGSATLRAAYREQQMRLDDLAAWALDGKTTFDQLTEQPSLQSRITASIVFSIFRPVIRAWLCGELQGSLLEVSKKSWDSVTPLIDTAAEQSKMLTQKIDEQNALIAASQTEH